MLFTGGEIEYVTYRGGTFHTVLPEGYQGLANKLVDRDVKVTARPATTNLWTSWGPVLLWTPWGPALLLMAFLLFFYPPGALRGGGSVPLGGGSGGPTSTIL